MPLTEDLWLISKLNYKRGINQLTRIHSNTLLIISNSDINSKT